MDDVLRQQVWQRAGGACEYCLVHQRFDLLPFQIDHVIASKHAGQTTYDNLALSCYQCNSYKGPNIAGIDPGSGQLCRLYHPRRDAWDDHFRWNGPELIGRTPEGKTTIHVLNINLPERVAHRRLLVVAGIFGS